MFRDSETGLVFHRGFIARSAFVVRLIQVVNFLFGVLYALFATRFVLEYIQARPVGFVQMIANATQTFYAPFRGIVANGRDPAGHPVAWSILICMGAFVLLHVLGIVLDMMFSARYHPALHTIALVLLGPLHSHPETTSRRVLSRRAISREVTPLAAHSLMKGYAYRESRASIRASAPR